MGDHKYEPESLEENIPWGPFISIPKLVQPGERPAAHTPRQEGCPFFVKPHTYSFGIFLVVIY